MLIPIVLSGGAGTRLWPVSREAYPKPFLRMPDGEGLLQKTLLRAARLDNVDHVLTLTNRDYYFQTRDDYDELEVPRKLHYDYILEPCGRNTAPAIAMAALQARDAHGNDAVLLVLPADHLIEDQDGFNAAVQQAYQLARDGYLVTFGIEPSRPETGFGYIQQGGALESEYGGAAYQVTQFVEKPDLETATAYLDSGEYLWNSGMFCFQARTILSALERHAPDVAKAAQACWEASARDQQPVSLDGDHFARIPSISIDYAVMEKAQPAAVLRCGFDWSDVGSWDAVSELSLADPQGNRAVGDVMFFDSKDCYVHSDGRLVATLGVNNLVVIDTPDALMLVDRGRTQDVKQIVQSLKDRNDESYRFHNTVHRPWGTYTVLEEGERFKIKRIVVKPGAALSLQMHHHRSEHWIVVSGTAEVVNGEKKYLVRTNESTYVPAGNQHRLSNPGIVDLVMIEVQSGEYLGEDDIVRIEDRYGRD